MATQRWWYNLLVCTVNYSIVMYSTYCPHGRNLLIGTRWIERCWRTSRWARQASRGGAARASRRVSCTSGSWTSAPTLSCAGGGRMLLTAALNDSCMLVFSNSYVLPARSLWSRAWRSSTPRTGTWAPSSARAAGSDRSTASSSTSSSFARSCLVPLIVDLFEFLFECSSLSTVLCTVYTVQYTRTV